MNSFLDWFQNTCLVSTDTHPIILATEAHLRFVSIHPFDDGNGRLSRLLMTLVLGKFGYLPCVIKPALSDMYLQFVNYAQLRADSTDLNRFMCEMMNSFYDECLKSPA